mmetsp:Transcript_55925/g.133277  ORF Transcript_55925/g.133277 Transcript_55925/m.133277 type:complete len:95 (+) Transcript_55925:76-360(+)
MLCQACSLTAESTRIIAVVYIICSCTPPSSICLCMLTGELTWEAAVHDAHLSKELLHVVGGTAPRDSHAWGETVCESTLSTLATLAHEQDRGKR